jgi:hypothetical protein
MYLYDGEIIQTDDSHLENALYYYGIAVFKPEETTCLKVGEEFALQFRFDPKKLRLVKVVGLQRDEKNNMVYFLIRRGAYYRPDELKGGLEKFLADQSVSEIDV